MKVKDVAQLMGVCPDTVRDWSDRGLIPCWRSPGGHRLYCADDVLAFMQARRQGGR